MLRTENLNFSYNQKEYFTFPDLVFEKAKPYAIVGPSGTGKTTLLNCLCGLASNYSGDIFYDDKPLSKLSSEKMDRLRGEAFGIVFQKNYLISAITAFENLQLAVELSGKIIETKQLHEMLEKLRLKDKTHSRPTELSEGEKQRLAIGRAMIHQPSIILADEPTSSLDDNNCNNILQLLIETTEQQGSTLIVITHDQRVKDKIKNVVELANIKKK